MTVDLTSLLGLRSTAVVREPHAWHFALDGGAPPLLRSAPGESSSRAGLRWVPPMIAKGSDFPSRWTHDCGHRAFSVIARCSLRRSPQTQAISR